MVSRVQLAQAIVKSKKTVAARRKASEASDKVIEARVRQSITIPAPIAGRDGRDAPELSEILEAIVPLLPTPKIESNTIVQKIDEEDLSGMVQAMLDAKIPEMEKSLRPKVELIREEIDTEGFVSKEDFDKALQRIQDAISYHSGGGSKPPEIGPLANVINANQTENVVTLDMLDITKLNIVHATVANSTVTLPPSSPNYIIWVEDAVIGGGNLLINKNQT